VVNAGITELLDSAIAGTASISIGGTDYTLSSTQGAPNEARNMFVTLTGTPGAARNVIVPAVSKLYFVFNNTTGGFAQTVKTPSGSGISVRSGQRRVLYCDGTNVVDALNAMSSISSTTALFDNNGVSVTASDVGSTSSQVNIGVGVLTAGRPFVGTNAGSNAIEIGTRSATPAVFVTDSAERMRITATGDVGIGTPSPDTRLDVASNSFFPAVSFKRIGTGAWYVGGDNAGATNNFRIALNTSNFVSVTTAGDVGIGIPNPAYKLVVVNGGPGLEFGPGYATGESLIQAYNRTTSAYDGITFSALSYIWSVSGAERMRLDTSGRLGIGATAPKELLDIATTVATSTTVGIKLGYFSSNYGYRLINSNNAGVSAAGTFSIQRGTTSSWVDVLTSDNNGVVTVPGNFFASSNVRIGTQLINSARLEVNSGGLVYADFTATGATEAYMRFNVGTSPFGYLGNAQGLGGTAGDLTIRSDQAVAINNGSAVALRVFDRNVFIANTAVAPAAPTGGGVLYVEAGALKYRGSSGTVTVIAPA
jgi:hypothetical protein